MIYEGKNKCLRTEYIYIFTKIHTNVMISSQGSLWLKSHLPPPSLPSLYSTLHFEIKNNRLLNKMVHFTIDKNYTPCNILILWFFTFSTIKWQFLSTYPSLTKKKKRTLKQDDWSLLCTLIMCSWTSDLFLQGSLFIYTVESTSIIKKAHEPLNLSKNMGKRKGYVNLQSVRG